MDLEARSPESRAKSLRAEGDPLASKVEPAEPRQFASALIIFLYRGSVPLRRRVRRVRGRSTPSTTRRCLASTGTAGLPSGGSEGTQARFDCPGPMKSQEDCSVVCSEVHADPAGLDLGQLRARPLQKSAAQPLLHSLALGFALCSGQERNGSREDVLSFASYNLFAFPYAATLSER